MWSTKVAIRVTLVVLLGVGLVLSGCSGGGGPGQPQPANTGTVRGQVVYFDFPNLPATGIEVWVGNFQTTTQDGWFEVDVPPGNYTVVVVPPEGFQLPPGDPPQVAVAAGQVVVLPDPFVLITEDDTPPDPY
ncbi:MAG: hypothetical protein J7M26_02345 [Armatimonadetes bacterium]|nr:hypothetical protein [Armatimonadota bacterium]